jgi:acetyl esterase/lipase
VPIGYLVAVVIVAWCTFFAVLPLRRPRALGRWTWRFSLVLNELPLVAGYWLLASTLLAAGQGDLDSPDGWAPLGLAVLTAAGLAVVAGRALRTGPAVERALTDGLGAGWRAAIDPGLAARLRRRRRYARILLWPFPVGRRDIERVADIRYGDAGRHNLLDVHRHRSRPAGGPVLVYVHGGGFTGGRKDREGRPLLHRLASQGWMCVSANYRLRPAATFVDHLTDVKKVIAWVREHGREYGGDPDVLFVAGSSAGAHLAATAALTPNDPAFQAGFEEADTSVAAAICLYGYYFTIYQEGPTSSPMAWVREDAPPFFVIHGDQDTFVRPGGARRFVARLRAATAVAVAEQEATAHRVVYAELPGAQHSFDIFHSIRFETVVDAIEAFAAWVRSGPASTAAVAPVAAAERAGGGDGDRGDQRTEESTEEAGAQG